MKLFKVGIDYLWEDREAAACRSIPCPLRPGTQVKGKIMALCDASKAGTYRVYVAHVGG